jgi:hypothetical protein
VKVVVCECGARNTAGGQCILCGKQLGSLPVAFIAGFAAALALSVAWALWFWITGIGAVWFAMLFGVAVSGAVVHFSFGRGWVFQAVASAATLVGIVMAQTLLLLLLRDRLDLLVKVEQPNLAVVDVASKVALNDPWVLVFSTFGLMGGFWVWKQPSDGEDG